MTALTAAVSRCRGACCGSACFVMSTREFAPWVQLNDAFSYLADVFWHDWKAW